MMHAQVDVVRWENGEVQPVGSTLVPHRSNRIAAETTIADSGPVADSPQIVGCIRVESEHCILRKHDDLDCHKMLRLPDVQRSTIDEIGNPYEIDKQGRCPPALPHDAHGDAKSLTGYHAENLWRKLQCVNSKWGVADNVPEFGNKWWASESATKPTIAIEIVPLTC